MDKKLLQKEISLFKDSKARAKTNPAKNHNAIF